MDSPLFSELLEDESTPDMEVRGFYVYTSTQRPGEALVQDIENSVGSHSQPRTAPTTYFDSADRPKEVKELWKSFINYGINASNSFRINFDSAVWTNKRSCLRFSGLSSQPPPIGNFRGLLSCPRWCHL